MRWQLIYTIFKNGYLWVTGKISLCRRGRIVEEGWEIIKIMCLEKEHKRI